MNSQITPTRLDANRFSPVPPKPRSTTPGGASSAKRNRESRKDTETKTAGKASPPNSEKNQGKSNQEKINPENAAPQPDHQGSPQPQSAKPDVAQQQTKQPETAANGNGAPQSGNQTNGKQHAPTPEAAKHAAASPGTDGLKEVVFLLDINMAKEVLLVGDFTEWQKHPVKLMLGGGGTWHTKVKLPPGRHAYRFLVDGQWHDDPNHAHRVANEFGSYNNVIDIA